MLKIQANQECDISQYWYFLNERFKFKPNVRNRSHDLLMMSMSLSDIVVLNFKSVDYCYIISGIRTIEAINLLQNIDLTEKSRTL